MPPTTVHFNGSVNLPDAETVMSEISSRIPNGVRRMTDGETGDRNYWISFQTRKFEQMPEFETVAVGQAYETAPDAPDMPQLRLTEDASAEMINWPDLGYADEYTKSFATFERMQNEGTIPADVRFQLQYPTPLASVAGTFVPDDLPTVAPSYEQALFADLDSALERLPHDRVAVQWDVAIEFGALEGAMGPKIPIDQIAPGLVRCLERVPADVPVGMHLCYGDYGHQHFKQPGSLKMQVDLVNAVSAGCGAPAQLRLLHRASGPQRQRLLRASRRVEDRIGHRTGLRAGALSPRRSGPRHDRRADRAHRRRSPELSRRRSALGDLHGMRDGPGRHR